MMGSTLTAFERVGNALAGALNDGTSVYTNADKTGFLNQAQNYLNVATAVTSTVEVWLQARGN